MYLRVTAFKSDPAKLDAGVAFLRDKVIPALSKAPGYLGATCVVDREKGTGAASTLWESLEAMNKAEQAGQDSRVQSEAATGIDVVDVDRFEITSLETTDATQRLPSYTRITMACGDPKNADRITATIREQVIPTAKKQPGFKSFSSGINRMTGRGFTASSWATAEQREASDAAMGAQLRQRVASEQSMYNVQVSLVETVIADIKVPAKA